MTSIGSVASRMFGSSNDRKVREFRPLVTEIDRLGDQFRLLSDEALRAKTFEFRRSLREGGALDNLLAPAFATVREAARRTLGQRHFDVQMLGGIVLHQGHPAE